MENLTATQAIERLSEHRLSSLDAAARASHLLNWWGLDGDDQEFATLPPDLQQQILDESEPPDDGLNPRYAPLLMIALRAEYRGVTHRYLMRCLHEAGLGDCIVSPGCEQLEACPCCAYRTLSTRGQYEICDLCGWEDDGNEALDVPSGPNHMTLGQAREHFARNRSHLPLDKWPLATEDSQ
jgi:hypothetical protein